MSIPALGVQASTLGCEGEKVTRSFNPSIHQGNWELRVSGGQDRVRAVGRNRLSGTVLCCLGITGQDNGRSDIFREK